DPDRGYRPLDRSRTRSTPLAAARFPRARSGLALFRASPEASYSVRPSLGWSAATRLRRVSSGFARSGLPPTHELPGELAQPHPGGDAPDRRERQRLGELDVVRRLPRDVRLASRRAEQRVELGLVLALDPGDHRCALGGEPALDRIGLGGDAVLVLE